MNARRALLAKIHIASKQLGLDRTTYEDTLMRVVNARSCKALSIESLEAVLGHFSRHGFNEKPRKHHARPKSVTFDKAPLVGKIAAQLSAGGYPESYADSMAKHMFGIDRYRWCNGGQLHKIVAALEYNRMRHHANEQ